VNFSAETSAPQQGTYEKLREGENSLDRNFAGENSAKENFSRLTRINTGDPQSTRELAGSQQGISQECQRIPSCNIT
jgi:hypothetical protein